MSAKYNRVSGIYHVTSIENFALISFEKCLRPARAQHFACDRELTKSDAPKVVFFTASYKNAQMPSISPYPRCTDKCLNKQFVIRITISTEYLNPIDQYKVYLISQPKRLKNKNSYNHSYNHTYFLFVNMIDANSIEWCEANIKEKEYDIMGEKWVNEDKPKPLYYDAGGLYSLEMNEKYIVNLAFVDNFQNAFNQKQHDIDCVTHLCFFCFGSDECRDHNKYVLIIINIINTFVDYYFNFKVKFFIFYK